MKKELTHEQMILLEIKMKDFMALYEGTLTEEEIKEIVKQIFFDYCAEQDMDPALAAKFLSKKFKEFNSKEERKNWRKFRAFERFDKFVGIEECEER